MDDTQWCGVTKEDIVVAAYGDCLEGGWMKNALKLNYTNLNPTGSLSWFGNGISVLGFVRMPLCQNLYTIVGNAD
ncbi:uncharacterized protein GLRG_09844 [Colletotrichum graminicola M1.001]|uniref:Uncharacterized protein n=1 Tax=Colletotrichum graminicola (strain M1.001 / M2 / FGSC 10212) TaxID=645133 RepID=E3QV10_COLGM|nr:uncharacterized protein GLRG_09844 [Colletotrichum graminicola M1.001]EFQ34700.1 hypothetical protein GLRG_09844 [Colletotrichum graminicola M1.001]